MNVKMGNTLAYSIVDCHKTSLGGHASFYSHGNELNTLKVSSDKTSG